MARPKAAGFEFDVNAGLDKNLNAFSDHVIGVDAALGAALQRRMPGLLDGSYEVRGVWDALLAATAASAPDPAAAAEIATAGHRSSDMAAPLPAQNPAALQPQPAPPAVSGWVLEGLSIEGFRGVNNEGQPLELKFYPDKVNSISAVNGVGKSSVHDAVRYAITGKLAWLEDLPAAERDGDYYLNRFNTSGTATIKLRLVAEPTGDKCEITVVRDAQGNRTISAPAPWNAEAILGSLDREFVFLDGPTFQNFISARPIDRGRTFSGLLGLSAYSELRQALAALANTRAFGNHFELTAHAQAQAREDKAAADAQAAVAADYAVLVGAPLSSPDMAQAQTKCHEALAQIGPLNVLCRDKAFDVIDIDACIEAVKLTEGGPKRERLAACLRERNQLAKLNGEAPSPDRAAQLAARAAGREEALTKTAGDLMLQLYQVGARVLDLPDWQDPKLCPLCDSGVPHDLRAHLADKLSGFAALDEATKALAVEWGEAGWAELKSLEAELEPSVQDRVIAKLQPRAETGAIARAEAEALATWLQTLRSRAEARERELWIEQTGLEKELPPSSVEVTKKVETARRLQDNWRKLAKARQAASLESGREARVSAVKTFLDEISNAFAAAEAAMSKARLAAIGPIFKDYYKRMWFLGVEPTVSKRANSEELQIRLEQFHGLVNLSPQALLSESSRNAFAISLYLAAASLYGGVPKFILLDDVTSSFDAGHQNFLVELIRTSYARPANVAGPQVILLSHDTTLEKLFNRHSNSGAWSHQRLEGSPQVSVLPQAGAVNKVRDRTISMLQAGQVDSAKEGVRQYLEYRLSELISKLRIPVPVDVAFNDNKQLAGEFLNAIDVAVKLHKAAGSLVLEATQESGLNTNMVTIVGNFLSHWGTGQTLTFTGSSLVGVMHAIDSYCECFTFEPTPGAGRIFYKSLHHKQ